MKYVNITLDISVRIKIKITVIRLIAVKILSTLYIYSLSCSSSYFQSEYTGIIFSEIIYIPACSCRRRFLCFFSFKPTAYILTRGICGKLSFINPYRFYFFYNPYRFSLAYLCFSSRSVSQYRAMPFIIFDKTCFIPAFFFKPAVIKYSRTQIIKCDCSFFTLKI